MKGLDNQLYVIMVIVSNVLAILQLIVVLKWPRIGRLTFFILFAWACWMNWKTAISNPAAYLDYADLTLLKVYRSFIQGWFSGHIQLAIGFIATCQGLIAASMLLKDPFFKVGCIAAIIFFVSILPLGIGAGFPCTAIMALSIYILLKKHANTFLWEPENKSTYA